MAKQPFSMFDMPYYALKQDKNACNGWREDTAKSKARLCEKRWSVLNSILFESFKAAAAEGVKRSGRGH